ncbi:MAG: hypothetical protein GXP27_08335 [Planctomycetes bacterium]|nr:hypothetical protein [Planctomycetota bacterium]
MKTLAYDKAANDSKVHRLLDRLEVAPIMQNRSSWQEAFGKKLFRVETGGRTLRRPRRDDSLLRGFAPQSSWSLKN